MADVSELTSFPFVRMCPINGLEGTENLATMRFKLRKISRKNERGQKIAPPLVSPGFMDEYGMFRRIQTVRAS